MKKLILFLALALLALPLSGMADSDQNPSGRKIAEMVDQANRPTNKIIWSEMTIIDKGKTIESRKTIAKVFRKDGRDRSFFRFMNGLKRNVTSFTIEKSPNEDNLQYTYVPGVGRPRQISSSEKQNDFEDTDLTNEDLGGLKINDYTYKRLKDKTLTVNGQTFDCYVILSFNKKSSARFPKKKGWVDKKTLLVVKSIVYGRDGRIKRQMFSANVKEIAPKVYMAFYSQVKDVERNHMTKNITTKVTVNTKALQYRQFTAANISKPWRER